MIGVARVWILEAERSAPNPFVESTRAFLRARTISYSNHCRVEECKVICYLARHRTNPGSGINDT